MKRQNIANLYQKQKYAKYELCKKICTENLLCKPQTVQGKFGTIQFGNRTIGTGQFGTKSIWHHGNIAPDNLAPGQFGTRTFWHQDNLAPEQFGIKTI